MANFDYTLTRDLDAPISTVWQAWTDSEKYGAWASAEEVALDVRPGGAWSAIMVIPDGSRIPLSGVYTEVVENQRLVVGMNVPGKDDPALMTVDLEPRGDQTRITISQTLETAEERDQTEVGSGILLDGLTAYVSSQPASK